MSQRPKDSGKLTSISNLSRVDNVMNHYEPKDRVVFKIKLERKKSAGRFFAKSERPDRPAFLTKKNIESRSYESNIARLNDELKKTGMLSERMTTSTVLPPTETQPYIPPTLSDVPDSSGLMGDNFQQPTYGGDESDSSTWDTGWSSNAYFKNSNDVGGETDRPILIQPDAPYPYDDGGEGSGIVFGSIAFGISVGVIDSKGSYRQILVGGLIGGTERPTEESRGFGGVYRNLSDAEFNFAVAVWNVYSELYGSDVGSGIIKAWKGYSRFHDFQSGGEFADWTVTPKRVTYGSEILRSFSYFKKSNTYVSDPGQPRTIVLNRLDDPDSPEFYPGDFSKYLADLLNLGKRGYDYLDQKSLEVAGWGLRPDGTQGLNNPGDTNRGHDGTLYKLVPRPGYGYNQWVPVKKASAGEGDETVVAHHEPHGEVLSEGWQSPDHTNVEKDQKTRWFSPNAGTDSKKWFDPEQIAPAYPKNLPPGMINGYSVKSNLAPKPVDKSPAIKLTKKDLLRNHRLKDSEVKEMMETINRLNEFLAKHPEELIYARSRYPKHDPRLAELNWKQDEMKRANDEYIEIQFPINKTVFKRTQEAIKKNIELTDPKSFKVTSTPIRHQDVTENKVRSIKKYMKPVKKTKPAFLRNKGKPNS